MWCPFNRLQCVLHYVYFTTVGLIYQKNRPRIEGVICGRCNTEKPIKGKQRLWVHRSPSTADSSGDAEHELEHPSHGRAQASPSTSRTLPSLPCALDRRQSTSSYILRVRLLSNDSFSHDPETQTLAFREVEKSLRAYSGLRWVSTLLSISSNAVICI
ncbi:hypothetical protein SCHPADRAFT_714957 [Schizopora paradoxa]|uniref:Uncharacterized protein n=1 Tax=Schizopora paradoxa TaxID=27342 RepID=A0A0H2R869_9AGAM|nr:hypothetical protein SCHPADRAFT_714957 [Schizopora paradoxa]